MIGLILAITDYEARPWTVPTEIEANIAEMSFVRVIISLLTALAIVSLLFRVYLRTYWQDHKNAADFQNMMIKAQSAQREKESAPVKSHEVLPLDGSARKASELGQRLLGQDAQAESSGAKQQRSAQLSKWVANMCTFEFLFELTILSFHPLPYYEKAYTFEFLDMNSKTVMKKFHYALGANFLFSLMFLRVYFIVRTCMNYTVYQELYAQKICHKHGFLSNAGFCIKALILKAPGQTIVLTCVISIMSLAYVLRLYEREYYRQLDEYE